MTELALLKMAHILGLVYWLGGDLGVFYSSFFVADEKRSPETRVAAAKILFTLDLAPRICMTLMLPTGIHLAHMMGKFKVPEMVVYAGWAICLAWLAMVLVLHFASHGRDLRILTKIDFRFRMVMVAVLIAFSLYTLLSPERILTDWIAYKTIVFASMIFFGLMIRLKLRAFTPAFKKLAEGTFSPADSRQVGQTLVSTRPFVFAIWFGILLNTAWSVRLI
jgi:hypothetical protein